MRKIKINTSCHRMLADVYTPVGIYLRLRDRFRDTVLLESTDHHAAENSWSFICINAIAGIEVSTPEKIEFKFPGEPAEKRRIERSDEVANLVWEFMQGFEQVEPVEKIARQVCGLFGYCSFESAGLFEINKTTTKNSDLPLVRYRLYQYVIAIDHFRDELFLCENRIAGIESEISLVESLIRSKDVPVYPFERKGQENSSMSDEEFLNMVKKGIQSCKRGDVFQVVLSRRFQQQFTGDEFNVYRALRSINPSPYLFFFDYGDYKLFGSSPEAQLVIRDGQAMIHPIAGTIARTGDDETDKKAVVMLREDVKENAEHVMLVDLARNDLSRECTNVSVTEFKQVEFFSHVIHLVSEVTGVVKKDHNPFRLLTKTFPAGTLSGAPKIRAVELITEFEPHSRGYYGGMIGFTGFNGDCNHAIIIRSLMSRNNTLIYQAGAGIVAASVPDKELAEVMNKLGALKKSIELAEQIH